MKTYTAELKISFLEAAQISRYLTEEPKSADECLGEDESISHTVKFENGYEMDIKCCGVQFDEKNDTNTAWTEAVLFNKDGHEVACSEVEGDYLGEWYLYDGKDAYVARVEIDYRVLLTRAIDRLADDYETLFYYLLERGHIKLDGRNEDDQCADWVNKELQEVLMLNPYALDKLLHGEEQ